MRTTIIILLLAVKIILASKYPPFNRNESKTRLDSMPQRRTFERSSNVSTGLGNPIPANSEDKYIDPSFLAQLSDYLKRTEERRTFELELCKRRADEVFEQITSNRKEETRKKLLNVVMRLWELKALKRKLLGDPMNGDEYRLLNGDELVAEMSMERITLNDINEFIDVLKADLRYQNFIQRVLDNEDQGTDGLESLRQKVEREEAERKVGKRELARRHVKLLLEQLYGEKPSLRTIKLFANRPCSITPQILSTLQSKTKMICNKMITKFGDNLTGLYEFKVYDRKPVTCGRGEVRSIVILGDCILDKYGVYKLRLILGQFVNDTRYYYIAIFDYACGQYKVVDYFIEISGRIIFEPHPIEEK